MANLTKICINCGKSFVFSTTEQDFYREHGYADPKRCYPCRKAYKRNISNDKPTETNECFACNPKMVKGVVTDQEHKCLDCGRLIEKSWQQYPVIAHHLRESRA